MIYGFKDELNITKVDDINLPKKYIAFLIYHNPEILATSDPLQLVFLRNCNYAIIFYIIKKQNEIKK